MESTWSAASKPEKLKRHMDDVDEIHVAVIAS